MGVGKITEELQGYDLGNRGGTVFSDECTEPTWEVQTFILPFNRYVLNYETEGNSSAAFLTSSQAPFSDPTMAKILCSL